jgi:hypothetical protein
MTVLTLCAVAETAHPMTPTAFATSRTGRRPKISPTLPRKGEAQAAVTMFAVSI